MAKRGRKSKPGKRTPSGQLPRAKIDRGNDRVASRVELFGTDGSDAIGRAYRAGLLGEHAKTLLDASRSVQRAYWATLPHSSPKSCLAGGLRGSDGHSNEEREVRREVWLNHMLAIAKPYRPLFDDLVIDINPDSGPVWLDRLLVNRGSDADSLKLGFVIEGLSLCAGIKPLDKVA